MASSPIESLLVRWKEDPGGTYRNLENAHRGKVDLVDEAVLSMAAELARQYTLG